MQTSTSLTIVTIFGLFLCCVLLTSQAEARCWQQWGVRVCNWESFDEDIQNPIEYVKEAIVEPLVDIIESLLGTCADSHNDRKERLMVPPHVHMVNPEGHQGHPPVYFVNGVLTTLYIAREQAKKLSQAIDWPVGWPVGLIHNPSSLEGDTGTPLFIIEVLKRNVERIVTAAVPGMSIPDHSLPLLLDDFLESLYDREWPNLFPNGCHTQFNPTTKQVTGLIYEAAEANAGPLIIVSHSQGNIIVRNGIMGAMHLGKEEWIQNNLIWISAAPPLTNAEMNRARWKTHVIELHPNDCIDLVTDLGGGFCDGFFGTHDFVETYIRRITPYLRSILPPALEVTYNPSSTLHESLKRVAPYGTLVLPAGEYLETLTINQPVRIESQGGPARIGGRR